MKSKLVLLIVGIWLVWRQRGHGRAQIRIGIGLGVPVYRPYPYPYHYGYPDYYPPRYYYDPYPYRVYAAPRPSTQTPSPSYPAPPPTYGQQAQTYGQQQTTTYDSPTPPPPPPIPPPQQLSRPPYGGRRPLTDSSRRGYSTVAGSQRLPGPTGDIFESSLSVNRRPVTRLHSGPVSKPTKDVMGTLRMIRGSPAGCFCRETFPKDCRA